MINETKDAMKKKGGRGRTSRRRRNEKNSDGRSLRANAAKKRQGTRRTIVGSQTRGDERAGRKKSK